MTWTVKSKGYAKLYLFEDCPHAIVKRKYGMTPIITWKGKHYNSVNEAKRDVEKEYGSVYRG